MASIVCPWCDSRTNFTVVYDAHLPQTSRIIGRRDDPTKVVAMQCNNEECGVIIGGLSRFDQVTNHWPTQAVKLRIIPDVPEHIAGAAAEAHFVHEHGAHRGAGALARAVVEATAKDKGITGGKLYDKIEKMHEQSLIPSRIRDGAHEVRHFGNDMAHGDFIDPVEAEEAAEILQLMDEVLDEVYQSQARLDRVSAKRLAKQQARKQPGEPTDGTSREEGGASGPARSRQPPDVP